MALLLFPTRLVGTLLRAHAAPLVATRQVGLAAMPCVRALSMQSAFRHASSPSPSPRSPILSEVRQARYRPSPALRYPPLLRLQSTAIQPELPGGGQQHTRPTRPAVAYHLFFCAAMVYLIIVVGGLTRLTESGLSITEWNPGFKGMRMPWTDAEWDAEWEKYKRTPEWAL